jgi:preprotein translocase subunit SecE
MARNRQRSKQRQADRRAARLAERGSDGQAGAADRRVEEVSPSAGGPEAEAELAAGAPPEELGRSDEVVEHPEPPAPDLRGEEADDEEAYYEEREQTGEPEYAPSGHRGPDRAEGEKERGRVMAFLAAVVAELKRVQWPDRKSTTTLTGVVLGFVLIAGGYLGLLDAIFSRVIQAIL